VEFAINRPAEQRVDLISHSWERGAIPHANGDHEVFRTNARYNCVKTAES